MATPFLISRRPVTTGEFTATVVVDGAPGQVMTVPVGAYYNDASVAASSLCSAIDTELEADHAGEDFTVTWSTTTGKFTIACTTGTITSWTWGSTAFRDWMGFTGNMAGSASYTSDNVAQGVIFTATGRGRFEGFDAEKSGGQGVGNSGTTVRIGSTETRRHASWVHEHEPLVMVASPLASGTDDTYPGATAQVPWTWYDFWEFHSRTGQPFRYYTAAGAAIASFENSYWLENNDKWKPTPVIKEWNGLWTVTLQVRPFVGV